MELLGMGILDILTRIDRFIWGPPLLVLLVGTGIFLTWKLGMIQVFKLPLALRYLLNSRKAEIGVEGDVSSFAALSTALSATVGTGNIVGVATAIKTGSPGALFWMVLAAFFGMATMYSESLLAVRMGISRGIFSNESGLGSAPIAAAAAKVKEPARQGLISMTGTSLDTIVICFMTGTVLVMTDSWTGDLAGAYMTSYAFSTALAEAGSYIVTVGLIFFAFTTILGWNYYGERCTEFLFGVKRILPYRIVYILIVASGAFLTLDVIWVLADIVNGLMAIPNLIALLALRKVVTAETRQYFGKLKAEASNPAETSK